MGNIDLTCCSQQDKAETGAMRLSFSQFVCEVLPEILKYGGLC